MWIQKSKACKQQGSAFLFLFFFLFYWSHLIKAVLTLLSFLCFSSLQMPQVLNQNSQGIDLHFWGQVLRALSEKIQLVSDPKSTEPCQLPSAPRSSRVTFIFSLAGNSPFPLFPVSTSLAEHECCFDNIKCTRRVCVNRHVYSGGTDTWRFTSVIGVCTHS